jgi:hypothetical protein
MSHQRPLNETTLTKTPPEMSKFNSLFSKPLLLYVAAVSLMAHLLRYIPADSKKGEKMNRSSDKYIYKALELAEALMSTANEGEAVSHDDGCNIFFAVCRDCAYKIRKQAQHQASRINLPRTG